LTQKITASGLLVDVKGLVKAEQLSRDIRVWRL